jgi:preprotein translocase subunit YajC
MHDATGRLVRRGDRVTIGGGVDGTVVLSIDTDEFSVEFPKDEWDYLGKGILVRTEAAGFVHLLESNEDAVVLS